jgi:tRNA threonylcarbamoyladenosine biosynthesis protein TsaB
MAGVTVTLLAIESATDMVGVALVHDDGGSAERIHVGGRAHAELLAPAIEEVCAVSGCTVADVDTIAVDVGPGLFTGLRVGVATAKALAQALGIGVVAVTSLDVLASAAAGRASRPHPVVSVVDARRGEVFAASYRFEQPEESIDTGAPVGGPVDPASVRHDRLEPISPEVLSAWLAELGAGAGRVTVVGDGAVRYRQLLSGHPWIDLDLAEELAYPPPLALAALARLRLDRGSPTVPADVLVPEYRRPADARINWEQRTPRVPAPDAGRGRAS